MNQSLGHEEIVRHFINSNAVDFAALGKFVTEFGPSIASSSRGDYGVRFGHYNILACFYNVVPVANQGEIGGAIKSDVVGR